MAKNRAVKLVIEAEVAGAKAALGQVRAETAAVGQAAQKASTASTSAASRMAQSATQNAEAWRDAGGALATYGAAASAAMGATAAAAISWQSSFAGVEKTVDGTASQIAGLESGLRGLATSLPATHSEIAGVAEAAGQLGVATGDITSFTKTMIDLGETTNLTAEEAAVGIAQISNVMGTAGADVEKFGSTLVALGNAGASTESEILEMATRLAGAGALIGASEADVLALSNAMASVGIQAQLGGGAMSRAMIEMNSAVQSGGAELDAFAKIAGMSAQAFAQAWQADPVAAIQAFLSGLAQIQAGGGDAAAALESVGLSGTENAQVFLRLSGAADMVGESLALGAAAWAENSALADEAAKRYQTVASQLQVARNAIMDAAISMGEAFLPVISAFAEVTRGAALMVADMPAGMKTALGWGTAISGAAALAAGGLMLVVPQAVATFRALQTLGVIGPTAAAGLRAVTTVLMGPWGVAIGGAVAALGLFVAGQAKARAEAAELAATLDQVTGAVTEATIQMQFKDFQDSGLVDRYTKMGGSAQTLVAALRQEKGAREEIIATVDAYAAANSRAAASTGGLGVNLSEAGTKGRIFVAAIDEAVAASSAGGAAIREMNSALEEDPWTPMGLGILSASKALAEWGQAQAAATGGADGFMTVSEQIALASDEAAEALGKWKGEMAGMDAAFIDLAAGLDATKFSLDGYLDGLEEMVEAQQEWEENMLTLASRGVSQPILEDLARLGPEGAQLVAALADSSDAEMSRFVDVMGQKGAEGTSAFSDAIVDAAPVIAAATASLGQDVAAEITAAIASGEMTAAEAVAAYNLEAEVAVGMNTDNFALSLGAIVGMAEATPATVHISAEDAAAMGVLLGFEGEVSGSNPTARINADDGAAMGVLLGFDGKVSGLNPTAHIQAEDAAAMGVLLGFDGKVSTLNPEAHIGAEASSAESAALGWRAWASTLMAMAGVDARTGDAVSSVNGLLGWIGRQSATISVYARMRGALDAGAALGFGMAAGGFPDRRPGMAGPGYGRTNVILWGEPETRGEAFISNHPAYRRENIAYLAEAARWFDMDLVKRYAAGGFGHYATAGSAPLTAPSMPSHVTLVDESGALLGRMRVVAQEQTGRAMATAVRRTR